MIDLLKVALLPKFVVGRACFFSDDSSFIKLFLKNCQLIAKFLVTLVDRWNAWNFTHIEFTFRFEFVPFGLELLQSFFHTEFNEKVT
jgi:hypothetical protein